MNSTQQTETEIEQKLDLAKVVDPLIVDFMTTNKTQGAIVSIQIHGQTEFVKGYGNASRVGGTPHRHTAFQIDSLTKAFTGIAVLRLLEFGGISTLDDPIGLYVKELKSELSMPGDWSGITIRQLLAMVSGIPDAGNDDDTYLQVLQSISNDKLHFATGTCYEYSNPNYMLLGMLIDNIRYDGCDYAAFVRRHVLDAFRLSRNTGLLEKNQVSDPSESSNNGTWVSDWRSPQCGYSAGGFCSTMHDLETLAGALSRREVLSPTTYDLMWTRCAMTGVPCTPTGGKTEAVTPFGCGWTVEPGGAPEQVAKNGAGYNWGAQITMHLPNRLAKIPPVSVCAMTNTAGSHANTLVKPIIATVVKAVTPGG
jgi:CubicO group peptidase (beta-lactamase class C family)